MFRCASRQLIQFHVGDLVVLAAVRVCILATAAAWGYESVKAATCVPEHIDIGV